METDPLIIK